MAKDNTAVAEQPQTSVNTLQLPEDAIKHIKLSDIYVDPNWNARSIANTLSEMGLSDDKEGSGMTGLVNGIAIAGQDTPVLVRPTTQPFYAAKDKSYTGQPYALVAGFRRFEAIRRLNEDTEFVKKRNAEHKTVVPNTANGTIRAIVKTMTEKEARIENTRENSFRESLDAPDLVFAVGRMMSAPHNMGSMEIATQIGKVPNYVTILMRIAGVDKTVLEHWRSGGEFAGLKSSKRATVTEMLEISKLDKERQAAEYKRVLESKPGVEGGKRDKSWMVAAKKTAEKMGNYLGTLERHGVITVDQDKPWIDVLEVVMKVHKNAKAGDKRKLADLIERSYNEALNAEEEAGTVDVEEEQVA